MPNRKRIRTSGGALTAGGEVIVIDSGGVDQEIDMGDLENYISNIQGTLSPQDLGAIADILGVDTFRTETSLGGSDQAYNEEDATGSMTVVFGDDLVSVTVVPNGTIPAPLGEQAGGSFTADSTILANIYPATAVTGHLGTADSWNNPNNGTGQTTGTFAEAVVANTVAGGDTFEGILELSIFPTVPVPSGFTQGQIYLDVYSSRTLHINDLDLLSTLQADMFLANVNVSTPQVLLGTWNGDSTNKGFGDERFLLTESQYATTDRIYFYLVADLAVGGVTTSNLSWKVNRVKFTITYTRSNIT